MGCNFVLFLLGQRDMERSFLHNTLGSFWATCFLDNRKNPTQPWEHGKSTQTQPGPSRIPQPCCSVRALAVNETFYPIIKIDVDTLNSWSFLTEWSKQTVRNPAQGSAFGHLMWSAPRTPSDHLEVQLASLTGGVRTTRVDLDSLTGALTNSYPANCPFGKHRK